MESYIIISIIVIVIMVSFNPYIRKSVINSKKKGVPSMPIESFFLITSVIMSFLVLATISIHQKDLTFGICAIIMLAMVLTLFFTKIKHRDYPSEYYWKIVLTSFLSIIPSFLFLYLISKKDVSYIDPILRPVTLTLIFVWGVFIFGETAQNNRYCWGSILIIIIGVSLFGYAKHNSKDKLNLNKNDNKLTKYD